MIEKLFKKNSLLMKEKSVSEVGFEPTPSERTRTLNTYCNRQGNLESGALDRSAILTYDSRASNDIFERYTVTSFMFNIILFCQLGLFIF